MKKLYTYICLAMVGLFIANFTSAQTISGSLSNFDVFNPTRVVANDFHVELEGIAPEQVGGLYLYDYKNAEIRNTGSGTSIEWNNGETEPGDTDHFGLTLSGDINPKAVKFYWTRDGEVIYVIPDAWQKWAMLTSGRAQDVLTNRSAVPIFVQRRINIIEGRVTLPQLMRDNPIWEEGIVIDREPVLLEPGQTLLFDFERLEDLNEYSVIMMYEMYENLDTPQEVRPTITFLNAAIVDNCK